VRLRVFTPGREAVDTDVDRVAVQAVGGAFTLLPRHVDVVAVLDTGLLAYHPVGGAEVFVAVDGGTVVKVGDDVVVSTPDAVPGDLTELRRVIDEAFTAREEHEAAARLALGRLEADVVQRLVHLDERVPT
jgi:F-type H+-transporting ATPase subunit epsilon